VPVITQKIIFREDLRANPGVLYVFGDNDMRAGLGGQAAEMRGEPNAVGVRTKWAPSADADAFFSDSDFDRIVEMIDEDLDRVYDHVSRGGLVVFPMDGIGTGLAMLGLRAPRVLDYLNEKIDALKTIHASVPDIDP
jgi:hypothetical protein